MIKLRGYLKPFAAGLLIAIVLLFGQAMSDLNLPNFMSKIVNIGIQQNGIDSTAPAAISESGMMLIKTFMTDDEKTLVNDNYTLVSSSDTNEKRQKYIDLYPKVEDKLYVKNDVDKTVSKSLDDAFGSATGTIMYSMKDFTEKSGQSTASNAADNLKEIDLAKLYQMQPMLNMIPKQTIINAHDEAIANDATILNQMGIYMTKAFYTELGIDVSRMQTSYIIRIGLFMLTIALLGGAATILVSLISSRIAAGVARNLRKDVFTKIEKFSPNAFGKFSTASLITRCTNDITQIQMLLMIGIRMLCYAPIMATGGIIMALKKSVSMSWIIAVAVITLVGMIMIVMAIAMPKFKIMQQLVDKLNLVSRENLSGMMVIRAFATQQHEKDRFEKANDDITKTQLFIGRSMVSLMTGIMLMMNCITLIIVWVGAHQIASSSMQVGDMMAFMQYAMQIIMSFMMISMMFLFVPRAAVSAVRISEVLAVDDLIKDPENPKNFDETKKGLVEFKNVFFRYDNADEDALCDITFTAKPGQTTAIIGSTGSGKSTIANLIMRFYDIRSGEILVDGVDIRQVAQKDLRSKIGYVPQKGVLLSGTISTNLKYGKKEAADDEIQTAAQVAQAMDFISDNEHKFEAPITQGGTNVSGGQKQRLSIARALVAKPEIYIFDDSFSALDFKTDVALRKALKEHTGQSTVIVVGQRISTIKNAEQIIVLDEGKIVGTGTHKELLKNCDEYYEIASSQLTQEELA